MCQEINVEMFLFYFFLNWEKVYILIYSPRFMFCGFENNRILKTGKKKEGC